MHPVIPSSTGFSVAPGVLGRAACQESILGGGGGGGGVALHSHADPSVSRRPPGSPDKVPDPEKKDVPLVQLHAYQVLATQLFAVVLVLRISSAN